MPRPTSLFAMLMRARRRKASGAFVVGFMDGLGSVANVFAPESSNAVRRYYKVKSRVRDARGGFAQDLKKIGRDFGKATQETQKPCGSSD